MAVITDFGFARASSVRGQQQLMQTSCGSVAFVAPEVISSTHGITDGYGISCDLWSVGCVLFCLMVGYPPFYQEPPEIFQCILSGDM